MIEKIDEGDDSGFINRYM